MYSSKSNIWLCGCGWYISSTICCISRIELAQKEMSNPDSLLICITTVQQYLLVWLAEGSGMTTHPPSPPKSIRDGTGKYNLVYARFKVGKVNTVFETQNQAMWIEKCEANCPEFKDSLFWRDYRLPNPCTALETNTTIITLLYDCYILQVHKIYSDKLRTLSYIYH